MLYIAVPPQGVGLVDRILHYNYAQCVRYCISTSMEAKYGSDWFQVLKRLDHESAQSATLRNREKYGSDCREVSDICAYCSSIDQLDFQGCNKILLYLEEVGKTLCEYFHRDYEFLSGPECKSHLKALISYRNRCIGHFNCATQPAPPDERDLEAVGHLSVIMKGLFKNIRIPDGSGKTFYEEFESLRYQLETRHMKKRCLFSEYFREGELSGAVFDSVCVRLGIQCEVLGGERVFYSATPQQDVRRILNYARDLEKGSPPAGPAPESPGGAAAVRPARASHPVAISITVIVALLCITAVILCKMLLGSPMKNKSFSLPEDRFFALEEDFPSTVTAEAEHGYELEDSLHITVKISNGELSDKTDLHVALDRIHLENGTIILDCPYQQSLSSLPGRKGIYWDIILYRGEYHFVPDSPSGGEPDFSSIDLDPGNLRYS